MNPAPENLSAALIERLAQCIPGTHRDAEHDLAEIEMILDLEGYDTTDSAWVTACRARAAWVLRDQRASFGALATFLNARMTNEEIGKTIGLPKSTVQAMGAGRVAERFKPAQREKFHALLNFQQAQIEAARRALG